MTIKNIIDFDVVNYKKPSLFIIFPHCSFKCDKENGNQYCQNWSLNKLPDITITAEDLIEKYYNHDILSAVVMGGLEPFDDFGCMVEFVSAFRKKYSDDIVIYSGYTEEEIADEIFILSQFPNIIVKFGRYKPNQKPHYDDILGVELASDNQYAKKI